MFVHVQNMSALNLVTANSFQELYALFGFRNMDDAMRNQSWCKSCRAKDNAERRARKSSS
jgi:hypothetical protein